MKKLGVVCLSFFSLFLFACTPEQEQFIQEYSLLQDYSLHTCAAYIDFVECCSEFSLSSLDKQQVEITLERVKEERATLPEQDLEKRCNAAWDIIVTTPEFSEHPQCGVL